MALFFVAIAVVVVAAAYFYLREQKPAEPVASKTGSFHAVSIRIDKRSACDAVRKISGQRFLSAAAPRLPLLNCSAKTCRCKFERHADRRGRPRRASETGTFEPLFWGENKREQSGGRRAEDPGGKFRQPNPTDFDETSSYGDFLSESGRHKKLEED